MRTARWPILMASVLATVPLVAGAAGPAGATTSATLSVTGDAIHPAEGQGYADNVAQFSDPSCGGAVYSATIDWGDGTVTAGGTNANPGLCIGNVIGSHTYAEEGTYTTSISVTGAPGSGSGTGRATIGDAALTAHPASTVNFAAHTALTAPVASFSDADGAAVTSDFTATINWGDGSAVTGGVISAISGGFQVRGTHTYKVPKAFTIAVTVTDAGGASGSTTTPTATVLVKVPKLTVTLASGVSGNMAKFLDVPSVNCGFTSYGASITWGDGTVSAGGVTSNGTCQAGFNVLASHQYSAAGIYKVHVKVTEATGAGGSAAGTFTVTP